MCVYCASAWHTGGEEVETRLAFFLAFLPPSTVNFLLLSKLPPPLFKKTEFASRALGVTPCGGAPAVLPGTPPFFFLVVCYARLFVCFTFHDGVLTAHGSCGCLSREGSDDSVPIGLTWDWICCVYFSVWFASVITVLSFVYGACCVVL